MKKIIGIGLSLLIIDQIVKQIFLYTMNFGETKCILPSFFSFTLVKNKGVAFSLFAGSQIPLIGLSIGVLLILGYYISKQQLTTWNTLSFGLLIGGILGNVIDRIFQNGVIDYLDFYLLGYDAPIFNLADVGVVIGAALLMIILWKEDKTCSMSLHKRTKI